MCRAASWVLVVLFVACGVAQGADGKKHSGKLSQWNVVEALLQNTLVEVSRSG
jgi:hypothetical protein